MTTDKLIEGIQILQKYRDKVGYDLGADHDVIYCYAPKKRIAHEDINRLIDLGWHQGNVGTDGEDFAPKHYSPEDSWWFDV